MKKIGVMLVDDHAVVRMGLSAIINLEKDMSVLGEAACGKAAAEKARELKPDVAVVDFMMPDMDGAETTAAILEASPATRVLILTTYGSTADVRSALAAGATGAVTKDLSSADLAEAVRAAFRGERLLSPEIEASLDEPVSGGVSLTRRQREVLESIVRGLSNDDIALLLGLSKSRVKQHLTELYRKLDAANRSEAVAIAMRRRLLMR